MLSTCIAEAVPAEPSVGWTTNTLIWLLRYSNIVDTKLFIRCIDDGNDSLTRLSCEIQLPVSWTCMYLYIKHACKYQTIHCDFICENFADFIDFRSKIEYKKGLSLMDIRCWCGLHWPNQLCKMSNSSEKGRSVIANMSANLFESFIPIFILFIIKNIIENYQPK